MRFRCTAALQVCNSDPFFLARHSDFPLTQQLFDCRFAVAFHGASANPSLVALVAQVSSLGVKVSEGYSFFPAQMKYLFQEEIYLPPKSSDALELLESSPMSVVKLRLTGVHMVLEHSYEEASLQRSVCCPFGAGFGVHSGSNPREHRWL